jgi:hypothetical protein
LTRRGDERLLYRVFSSDEVADSTDDRGEDLWSEIAKQILGAGIQRVHVNSQLPISNSQKVVG